MEGSMERLHIDISERDVGLGLFLLKKKIKIFQLAVLLMLSVIILVVVISVVLLTKANSEIRFKSNRTENTIKREIQVLKKSYNETLFAISRTNDDVITMEKRTNERINEIIVTGRETNNHVAEMEKKTNKRFVEITATVHETNNHAAEIEERMNKRIDEILGKITELSTTISRNNNHTNEIEKITNKRNDEILGRISGMSFAVSELQFKLEKKNSMFILKQNDYCLDTMHGGINSSLELYSCHELGHNQEWQFTVNEELKNRKSCLTFRKDTPSNSVQVKFDECNGSASQKCKFVSGVLQSIEHDVCVQTKGKVVFAATCNSSISEQIFERKILYKIEQVCTFKQGSYALFDNKKVIVADNGFLLHDTKCFDSTFKNVYCNKNSNRQKWEYINGGQLKNKFENLCVEKRDNSTVALKKCNSNSESQKWICL